MNTHIPFAKSRREFLHAAGGGLGGIALNWLLACEAQGADAPRSGNPLVAKKPHFEPKAKRVIFLFSTGGVSHLDTFDPKPRVINADGKAKAIGGGLSDEQRPLLRAGWAYKPGGKCGGGLPDLVCAITSSKGCAAASVVSCCSDSICGMICFM